MAYVRSRVFCCCLPVRFGVFVMAVLGILGGGFIAVVGWAQIAQLAKHPLDQRDKIALIVQTIIYTLLALLSFCGLIGTFNKSRSLISVYSTMLCAHLGFSIVTGIFYLYTLFHQTGQTDIQKCIDESTDDATVEACKKGFGVIRAIIVVVFVIVWLLELYGCIIVSNYTDQLDEEKSIKHSREASPGPAFNNNYGANYPFATSAQSYGVQGHSNNV